VLARVPEERRDLLRSVEIKERLEELDRPMY
jgi:hypothetical protein